MPGGDTSGSKRTPVWNVPFLTGTTADCGTCHGFPPAGATGPHALVSIPATFTDAASICKPCHANINSAGTSYSSMFIDKSKHINGITEAAGGCNGCHGYPPAKKGFTSFAGFKGNWSGARLENYSGGGGAHTVAGHLSPALNVADGWANCTKCHNQADHNTGAAYSTVKVTINPSIRFDNARTPVNNSYAKYGTTSPNAGKCSNVACHFQKTPKW
jgi:hypothetical protein